MKSKKIKRGEIYYYDFGDTEGSIQSGRRPVLVLQTNNFNQRSTTVIVAAITGVIKKRYLPSHIILSERFGLSRPSMVLLEQISTIDQRKLGEYVGYIDDERVWRKIGVAIKQTLGLLAYPIERTANVRCLCPKCLKGYLNNPNYIVKRLDPFAREKEKCDKCNEMGWDYIVLDRRTKR